MKGDGLWFAFCCWWITSAFCTASVRSRSAVCTILRMYSNCFSSNWHRVSADDSWDSSSGEVLKVKCHCSLYMLVKQGMLITEQNRREVWVPDTFNGCPDKTVWYSWSTPFISDFFYMRWKTTLIRDCPDERPPDERPPWWKTTLMKDHPSFNTAFSETFPSHTWR